MKQNIYPHPNTLSLGTIGKAKPNRHVSVLYGMQYLTKVPIVKRCRKTQQDCFLNINKKQIFTFVYRFISKLLQSEEYLQEVLSEMKFNQNQFQTKIVPSQKSIREEPVFEQKNVQQNSLNDIQFDSFGKKDNFSQNTLHFKVNNKAKQCKKISIMINGQLGQFDNQTFGSQLFSDESLMGISSINISEEELTLKMVQKIYEQPQPFLINLSVSLMLKFLSFSDTKLSPQNVCWILSIGTIVAYKIYYDEPVQGLVNSFAYILKISREDIISLQRYFLSEINHEAVISNEQYHLTLYNIIRQEHGEK